MLIVFVSRQSQSLVRRRAERTCFPKRSTCCRMVSTEQWRAAIGRWVRGCLPRGGGARGSAQGLGLLASMLGAAVVAVLLAIGGVELNPGPPTNGDIIDTINRNHREMIDRIDVLQARVASAEGTVQSLQTANEQLARKVDYLENQSRRNNVIVTGIPEQQNESWADSERCILGLAEQLGVRLELPRHRARAQDRTTAPRTATHDCGQAGVIQEAGGAAACSPGVSLPEF